MTSPIVVYAPSRLHFGMFSLGHPSEREFGGVGVMIDQPGLQLRVARSDALHVTGPLADRAADYANRYFNAFHVGARGYRIEVLCAPPDHVGLGVGTQLALSVAVGLRAAADDPPLNAVELAAAIGRGERSAIGTYGFDRGGLLVEAGKLLGERVSPLSARIELPETWRFVLVIPRFERGRHGVDERQAFSALPPVPPPTTAELRSIVAHSLVPAAMSGDFQRFSEHLYHFGHRAGECFAKFQHGAFATERLLDLVERFRASGIQGVGQSSWGPTIFALISDKTSAEKLVQSVRNWPEAEDSDVIVAAPQNRGAQIAEELDHAE
jgi:beta-RFAP synthase